MPRETNPKQLLVINKAVRSHPNLKYLFLSTLKDSFHNDFGCTKITTDFTDATGLVYECNSPKPARASKRTSDPEIEGAYCAYDKTATLRGNRFSIVRPLNKVKLGTALTDIQYVNINGLKMAWRSNKPSAEQLTEIGDFRTLLGIELGTFSDKDLVFGATFPRLPRVQKSLNDGSKFSSFCDNTKVDDALAAGWSLLDSGLYTAQDLNDLLR